MSRIEVPSKPFSAKSSTAASIIFEARAGVGRRDGCGAGTHVRRVPHRQGVRRRRARRSAAGRRGHRGVAGQCARGHVELHRRQHGRPGDPGGVHRGAQRRRAPGRLGKHHHRHPRRLPALRVLPHRTGQPARRRSHPVPRGRRRGDPDPRGRGPARRAGRRAAVCPNPAARPHR